MKLKIPSLTGRIARGPPIVALAALALLLVLTGPALAVTIDTFNQGDFWINPGVPPTGHVYSVTTTGVLTEILGGERETSLVATSYSEESAMEAMVDNVSGGPPYGGASQLIWNQGDSIKGYLTLLYDGVGTPGSGGNVDGLGSVDLTDLGQQTGFGIVYGGGDGSRFDVTITVVSGIGEGAVGTSSTLPLAFSGSGASFIPFTALAGTADITGADSVKIVFDSTWGGSDEGDGGGDYGFDLLQSTVPEPVTMAGLLMGVGGLAGYVRKRRFA